MTHASHYADGADLRRAMNLLSPAELAIILADDPTFTLPAGVANRFARLDEARAINARGSVDARPMTDKRIRPRKAVAHAR